MELTDVLAKRRMVRNYTDEPVDADALARIVGAGVSAPSAGFSQGQRFVIVTDDAHRAVIADAAHEQEYVADGFAPWISKAPAHIVICTDKDAYLGRYSEPDKAGEGGAPSTEDDWPVPYWWVDAGASLMAILLAAVNEGLAAGFLGSHNLEKIHQALSIPPGVLIIGVVTIGHPASDRRSSSLSRGWNDLSDVVYHDTWGSHPAHDNT